MPVWLNEGMAQLFEEGIWTGDELLARPGAAAAHAAAPGRHRQTSGIIDFEKLLRMTPEQWAANLAGDHDVGATQYNQSWAMVHFLVHARDDGGKEKYRARLIQMLELLHDGKDGARLSRPHSPPTSEASRTASSNTPTRSPPRPKRP